MSIGTKQPCVKKPPMAQIVKIIPTSPRTSNNDLGGSTEPHTLTKSKSAAADKDGKLRSSVNFNMDVKD